MSKMSKRIFHTRNILFSTYPFHEQSYLQTLTTSLCKYIPNTSLMVHGRWHTFYSRRSCKFSSIPTLSSQLWSRAKRFHSFLCFFCCCVILDSEYCISRMMGWLRLYTLYNVLNEYSHSKLFYSLTSILKQVTGVECKPGESGSIAFQINTYIVE